MSVTSVAPEQLRPELHQRIDRMDAEQLELLQHILPRLELDEVVATLRDSFDIARRTGKLGLVDSPANLRSRCRAKSFSSTGTC